MPACEKCWRDSRNARYDGPNSRTAYSDLVRRRDQEGKTCTPEEQCGELHVIGYRDGEEAVCACGKNRRPLTEDEVMKMNPAP